MILNNLIERLNSQNNSTDSFLEELKKHLTKPFSATYTVDRIEENYAVCENMKTLKMENILVSFLPSNIKEGSIIKLENGIYSIDPILQEKRENELNKKIKKAWKK